MNYWTKLSLLSALAFVGIGYVETAFAAEVIVDRPLRAGDLTVYRSAYDENSFYYLPDKPVLATTNQGTPKFSFLQYVRGREEVQIAGGGIVHAVVKLEVTQEQIQTAQRDLRQSFGGSANIVGPVPFHSGKVSLVSATTDEAGEDATVVGTGTAPALEGQQVAIAASLPPAGAEKLYATLSSPAPDFSISFAMSFDGFNSPVEATVKADWGKIYNNKDISAAAVTPILTIDLRAAYEDLRKEGAIEIDVKGDNAAVDAAVKHVYEKLTQEAFSPVTTTSPVDLKPTAGDKGNRSLTQATALLKAGTEAAKEKKLACEKRNAEAAKAPEKTKPKPDQAKPENEVPKPEESKKPEEDAKPEDVKAEAKEEDEGESDGKKKEESGFLDRLLGNEKEEAENKEEDKAKAHAVADNAAENEGAKLVDLPPKPESKEKEVAQQPKNPPEDCNAISEPLFAAAVSYQLKKIRHSGKFELNMRKYTATTSSTRFDLDLSGISRCSACVNQANIDSELNQSKEIVISMGGEVDAAAFDSYLNSAEVRIRKEHENGQITNDAAVITKRTYVESENQFKLRYLWNEDRDRDQWPFYQYKVVWNLFGGEIRESNWQDTNTDVITLTPPIEAVQIGIEVPPSAQTADLLGVTVETQTSIGHRNTTTLNVLRNELSKFHKILVDRDSSEYEFTLTLQRADGDETRDSRTSVSKLIFVN